MGLPILLYEQECDDVDCWESVQISLAFVEQYFADAIVADWDDGEYEWENEDAFEDAFEQFVRKLDRYMLIDE